MTETKKIKVEISSRKQFTYQILKATTILSLGHPTILVSDVSLSRKCKNKNVIFTFFKSSHQIRMRFRRAKQIRNAERILYYDSCFFCMIVLLMRRRKNSFVFIKDMFFFLQVSVVKKNGKDCERGGNRA